MVGTHFARWYTLLGAVFLAGPWVGCRPDDQLDDAGVGDFAIACGICPVRDHSAPGRLEVGAGQGAYAVRRNPGELG